MSKRVRASSDFESQKLARTCSEPTSTTIESLPTELLHIIIGLLGISGRMAIRRTSVRLSSVWRKAYSGYFGFGDALRNNYLSLGKWFMDNQSCHVSWYYLAQATGNIEMMDLVWSGLDIMEEPLSNVVKDIAFLKCDTPQRKEWARGLLKPIRTMAKTQSTDRVINWYNSKGVYFIWVRAEKWSEDHRLYYCVLKLDIDFDVMLAIAEGGKVRLGLARSLPFSTQT